jgi:hypothetical protein
MNIQAAVDDDYAERVECGNRLIPEQILFIDTQFTKVHFSYLENE